MFGTSTVADTLTHHAAQGEHGEAFNFAHLLEHVKDGHEIELPGTHVQLPHFEPLQIGSAVIDLSPTKHVVFLLLAALVVVVLAVVTTRQYRKSLIPRGFTNLMEILVLFVRDEIAYLSMGKAGEKYVPFLLTTFFFILIMNLAGLVPFGATATGNIAVTAGLAIIAFFMIQISAIRTSGLKHYLAHLTGGVHWALWPIMIPIEILGLFTKPFALCMRLFANMTGGHIVILSFIGLIFLFKSAVIAPVSVLFALAIYMLELFVAFLQAYVFTMLTALFMGLGMQAEHGGEEHESHS